MNKFSFSKIDKQVNVVALPLCLILLESSYFHQIMLPTKGRWLFVRKPFPIGVVNSYNTIVKGTYIQTIGRYIIAIVISFGYIMNGLISVVLLLGINLGYSSSASFRPC